MSENGDYTEIRAAVRKLCERFPGEYWRKLDRERSYPTEFVTALTEAGYLASLIPEAYGGAGLPLSAAVAILGRSTLRAPMAPPATPRCT
jgi:acyl-CoA dehydrogenase